MPKESIAAQLQQDYKEMLPMFFEKPPEFNQIIRYLEELEQEIHSLN